MKGLRTFIAGGALALALLPAPGAVSAAGIEMAVGVWNQDPKGEAALNPGSTQDVLSLRDDLKYNDTYNVYGRVKIDMPLLFPNIYLMATPLEYDATGVKGTAFRFGDVQFAANAPFASKLKLDHYDVGFYYGIPGLKTATAGILNVDLGLDLRVIDFEEKITGQDAISGQTVTQSESFIFPAPMLYLGVQVKPVNWLAVEAEGLGLAYGGNYYYDLIGRGKLKLFGPIFVAGGYRYEKIHMDTNDAKADARFSGPFGEGGVEF